MKWNTNSCVGCAGTPARFTADYFIALLPIYIWSIYLFGAWSVHLILSTALLSSLVLSVALQLAFVRKIDYNKLLSAMVNGFCVGFLMPADAPMWLVVLGVFVANIWYYIPVIDRYATLYIHPIALSITALSFLFQSMEAGNHTLLIESLCPVTPTRSLLDGFLPEEGIYDLLLGRHSGLLGEVSVLMILIGGVYLFMKKRISLLAPLMMLGSLFVLSYLFPVVGARMDFAVAQLFSGGVWFTAVYLLPFYGTKPATDTAKLIEGILCGVLTYLLRCYFSNFDGVFIALLLSAALTKLIEPFTVKAPIHWQSEY